MSLLNQSVPVPKAFQLSSINKGIQKKNGSLGKLYKQMCLHSNMDQSQQQIRKLKKVKLSRFLFFLNIVIWVPVDSIVRFSILWYISVDDHCSYLATSKKELWLSIPGTRGMADGARRHGGCLNFKRIAWGNWVLTSCRLGWVEPKAL